MSKFSLFEFTPEVMEKVRGSKEIPVHFYNKEGQILLYKKENASEGEIERLFRFVQQGIYYNEDDSEKLGLRKRNKDIPEGLSDTKLLSVEAADTMAADTSELFDHLKKTSINSFYTRRTGERMSQIFTDFESQPDAMNGLVNIIELMSAKGAEQAVELAVKRTVTAMALKMRGLVAQSQGDRTKIQDMMTVTMTSALLCDIGYTKMKMPTTTPLTAEEMAYIQNHPLMSYLMVAHEPSLDTKIKRNILVHHRPLREGMLGNNYPETRPLITKLTALEEKYGATVGHDTIAKDVREQLALLRTDIPYDEDANILSIASEFASLTSKAPWRDAYDASRAVRMIINNSFFTHTPRILREFLDHVAISLCDNEKILNEGDFIVLAAKSPDGKSHFEVCRIVRSDRYQSKPEVARFGTIMPIIEKVPKLQLAGFQIDTMKEDPRRAKYDLVRDDSRQIVYAVDPAFDRDLHNRVMEMVK